MDLGLKGKVALVAASSKGLGKAAALELAREGAEVAITARDERELETAAAEIRHVTGGRVLAWRADVSVGADLPPLVQGVVATLGPIDILVNNAGGPRPGEFTDLADEDWLAAFNLNLMSAVRLSRLVLPEMRQKGWGRIINITSVAVKQPMAGLILSNAVRAGVVGMAKSLSNQVAADGITVNNVCPGYTATNRMERLAVATAQKDAKHPEEIMAQWKASIPARRLGRPEELAALIAFLASERAAYITGTTIPVDGGYIQSLL